MIFPIGDQNVEGGHRPYVTYLLMALNVGVFLFQSGLDVDEYQAFIHAFGAVPSDIVNGNNLLSLFTSTFLHGNFAHLFGNMLFLWVFADNIEAVAGHGRFLVYYLAGGIIAGLIHVAFNLQSTIPAIGASGAISAVLGTYFIFFPRSEIRVLVLFFFRSVYVPALFFLGIWIAMQLYSGVGSLNASGWSGSGVAWWAHIGGFFFGVLYGLGTKRKLIYHHIETSSDQLV